MKSEIQDHPLYWLFNSMKKRCRTPTHVAYASYGGRGIKVCDRWLEPNGSGFRNFVADMGERPAGTTLDRINNDGNYEPSNCRWATRKEQYSNRRTNVRLSLNGETKTITEWAKQLGHRHSGIIQKRLESGVPLEIALTEKRLAREIPRSTIDAAAKKRKSMTHCKYGHEFTPENTYLYNGGRTCRACKREATAKKRALEKLNKSLASRDV
jgi:hypothetical protein